MKKNLILAVLCLIISAMTFAQVPQKMSYQAVVRGSDNNLVTNSEVSIRISILQGSADGEAVYTETHSATTNANGLLTIEIGDGASSDDFSTINWANGPYFVKTETDVNGGDDYSIIGVSQLLSVPYAMYAQTAGNVPDVSGFLTEETDPTVSEWAKAENKPIYNYSEIEGTPEIPTVPTNVSAFENDANYVVTEADPTVPAWAKAENKPIYNYSEIEGTPEIPTVPTNVSAFENDANYLTSYTETQNIAEVASLGNSVNTQLKDVTDPTDAQDAVTKQYLDNLIQQYASQISALQQEVEALRDAIPLIDYDGNTYATVRIGDQVWMAENLRTTHYSNGTSIPQGTTTSETDACWYYPNNDASNEMEYGLLYNWPAAMNGASSSETNPSGVLGICPNGWHLPSDAEWTELINYVGSQSEYQCNGSEDNIAKSLASTFGWNSDSETCTVGNNQLSNNATGFGAVPAGDYYDSYRYFGRAAAFWSSTESGSGSAYIRYLNHDNASVRGGSYPKNRGRSIRCLRD